MFFLTSSHLVLLAFGCAIVICVFQCAPIARPCDEQYSLSAMFLKLSPSRRGVAHLANRYYEGSSVAKVPFFLSGSGVLLCRGCSENERHGCSEALPKVMSVDLEFACCAVF
jgi:hypothetical protein